LVSTFPSPNLFLKPKNEFFLNSFLKPKKEFPSPNYFLKLKNGKIIPVIIKIIPTIIISIS